MKKNFAGSKSQLLSEEAHADNAIFQIQVLPLKNRSSNLTWDRYDDEPVIWFAPVIVAALAIMTLLGGVIVGVVTIFRRLMVF
ncbi:MAG: hypothetical protein ACHQYP_04785 [Nitrospiria bacterium]